VTHSVNYDLVAPAYDKRYERNRYDGVEAFLRRFIGDTESVAVAEVGCGTGHWLAQVGVVSTGLLGSTSHPRCYSAHERPHHVRVSFAAALKSSPGHRELSIGSSASMRCIILTTCARSCSKPAVFFGRVARC
jgi:hypothetical protein